MPIGKPDCAKRAIADFLKNSVGSRGAVLDMHHSGSALLWVVVLTAVALSCRGRSFISINVLVRVGLMLAGMLHEVKNGWLGRRSLGQDLCHVPAGPFSRLNTLLRVFGCEAAPGLHSGKENVENECAKKEAKL